MNLIMCRTDFKNDKIFENYLLKFAIDKRLWPKIVVIVIFISNVIELYDKAGNAILQDERAKHE
ncbi:MAG: hypothetical protein ACFE9S_07490 [Candidatus Hermodarchaeota archaeon]